MPRKVQVGRLRFSQRVSTATMLRSAATWFWMLSGILMIISVLLHSPKGDGMGGLAASGGSMFTSARSAENTLNRVSWTLLAIFMGLAVVLSAGWLN